MICKRGLRSEATAVISAGPEGDVTDFRSKLTLMVLSNNQTGLHKRISMRLEPG
jgi:hypothetical protein